MPIQLLCQLFVLLLVGTAFVKFPSLYLWLGGSLTISEGTIERDIEIFEHGRLVYFHDFARTRSFGAVPLLQFLVRTAPQGSRLV